MEEFNVKATQTELYIATAINALGKSIGKLDVAEFLTIIHGISPREALSIVYEIEDRGLATNLGNGYMELQD